MPLDTPPQLKSDLENIFTSFPVSAAIAGVQWADAYDSFAKTGTAGGVAPTVTPPVTAALEVALGVEFAKQESDPQNVATAIGAALVVYWTAVTFVGSANPPVATAGLALLVATLTAILKDLSGTASSKAQSIRDALYTFTASVVVNFPPPSNVS